MTNYTQYTVIERDDLTDLVRVVNQDIKDGWQPLGGVAVYEASYGPKGWKDGYQKTFYSQAVVK